MYENEVFARWFHLRMRRNEGLVQNQNKHVISSCVHVCKTHMMRAHIKHSSQRCRQAVCLVVTSPGAASTERLCKDFSACAHSDPHVFYSFVCMCEDQGMKTSVRVCKNKMKTSSTHACMYATHAMYARVKHSCKCCRLALLQKLARSSAASTQRLCLI
jgi:hypothetical protein